MSVFLDQKYLTLISNRLPLFKRKSDKLYNCRCIICGDSVKKKNKARGYFFEYKTELRYKCHNCDASMAFGTFLKNLDNTLHSQYTLERYSEGNGLKSNSLTKLAFEEPKFKSHSEKLLDELLVKVDTLPDDHEAVLFCLKRNISKQNFRKIYFIENIKNIVKLNDKYKESIKGEEPRIILPFYDESNQLTGVTCRAIRGEALRYITVKIKEESPLIFGLDSIDKNNLVYVVEGPIDSLFLDNCIAVAGTSFNKTSFSSIAKENLAYIYDNQPRNMEICKLIERSIDQGHKVVIWPQNIVEKDINDMVIAGRNIKKIVQENIYSGLTAKAKFYSWKRV